MKHLTHNFTEKKTTPNRIDFIENFIFSNQFPCNSVLICDEFYRWPSPLFHFDNLFQTYADIFLYVRFCLCAFCVMCMAWIISCKMNERRWKKTNFFFWHTNVRIEWSKWNEIFKGKYDWNRIYHRNRTATPTVEHSTQKNNNAATHKKWKKQERIRY